MNKEVDRNIVGAFQGKLSPRKKNYSAGGYWSTFRCDGE
jgi:hypothetical protein